MTEIDASGGTVTPLQGKLPPQCETDLNSLRRFVHAAISRKAPGDAVPANEFREVLLTGATGFVGRFVLRDLLRQDDDLLVHCIVRSNDAGGAFERVRAALQQAEIWEDAFASRIRVVPGDVAAVRFGLSEVDFGALCQRIDAVYHLAAELTLASPYVAVRKVNTFSIRNVLELSLRTRYKHVFFTSSMGVFPQYFFAFGNEFRGSLIDYQMQPDLGSMKRKYPLGLLGYPWSKLVAEQALLFAHSAGLPVGIFRLPRTGLSSTGFTQANDVAVRLLAAVADVQLIPQGLSIKRMDEPVDTLSEIVTAISRNPLRRFTLYHCCDPQPALHEFELADFGLYWPEVPYTSFKSACQARGEKSPLHGHWALLDHFAPYWFGDRNVGGPLPICDRAIREDCPRPIKWPGSLTLTKRSADWIARQEHWPHPVPQSRLDFACLIRRARRHARSAGVDFDIAYPEWMRRGLQQLVQALKAPDVRLLDGQIGFLVFELSRLLRNNAVLAHERQDHPEIDREEVARPVFIVGINRTGTTFLHRLMARDPRFWALRSYECFEPAWPGDDYAMLVGTPADPRRKALEDMFEAAGTLKNWAGIHDFDIDEPEEDFPLMRLGFAAWTTLVRFHLPDYRRWLAASDFRRAYAYHRRIMQHFTWQRQRRGPRGEGQWLFKMPFHLMELEALMESYPDALFVQTHREPTQLMGSWNSLVERVRSVTIEPRPPHQTGAEQLAFMSGMLDKAVRFRLARPEMEHRWMDVNYIDLIEHPFGTVRRIYEHFGWTLEGEAVHAMEAWHERQSQKRRTETRHRYDLKDYGLTPEAVNEAFASYRDFLTSSGIRARP